MSPEGVAYMKAGPYPRSSKQQTQQEEFRRELYETHVVYKRGWKFESGPRTRHDASRLQEQTKCKHAFENLYWRTNQHGITAVCSECGAKSVVYCQKVKSSEEEKDEKDKKHTKEKKENQKHNKDKKGKKRKKPHAPSSSSAEVPDGNQQQGNHS